MPTILKEKGYRFFFYSSEGDPREPPHIHVASGEKLAKFWLEPLELASSKRLQASEVIHLLNTVNKHRNMFLEAWHAHFDT